MKRKYDEKLLEGALRDHPQDFLGEPLELLGQQPTIGGFRPDLIFKDQRGIPVILEVQLKALDRSHLYRSLEYRDLYRLKTGADAVRVILFCNSIPSKYERVLATHNVDCRKIAKKDFLKKLISLVPKIKVAEATWDKKISSSLTPGYLLREIHKISTEENSLFPPDTFAFWIAVGSPNVIRTQKLTYPLANVSMKNRGFIDPRNFHGKDPSGPITTIETRLGPMEVCVPLELFACWKPLEKIDHRRIQAVETLLDLIYDFSSTVEISLGNGSVGDPFGWYGYIESRKMKFGVLCDRYSEGDGYDIDKIRDDLEWLLSLKVYIGKYPHFVGERVIKSYEIIQGPGLQQRKWYETMRESLKEHRYEEKIVQEFDIHAQKEEKKWVTIRLNDVSELGKAAVLCFLNHTYEYHIKWGRPLMIQCDRCVSPPRKANEIPPKALKLTSRFFWHLGPIGKEFGLQKVT